MRLSQKAPGKSQVDCKAYQQGKKRMETIRMSKVTEKGLLSEQQNIYHTSDIKSPLDNPHCFVEASVN